MKTVAIVGFGFMGNMHAQVYQQLRGAKLTAAVDINCPKAEADLAKAGLKIPVYSDLDTLFAKEKIDVVDICLPTYLHASAALLAIEAGKHVFCEKPFALSVKDAEKVAIAAEKAGILFMVGHCIRFWPEYQALVELVRSNKAGRLLSLAMQRRSSCPTWSSDGWLLDGKRSGGAALDLHIHDTDFAHHLLGKPRAVTSHGTKDANGWSHIFTSYHFEGMAVTAEGGWNYPPKWGFQMAFQAVFENGAVEYDIRAKPTLVATLGGEETKPLPFKEPQTGSSSTGQGNVSALGGYYNELAHFFECLESNQLPQIATARQALESLRTALAEIQSAARNQTISL